MAGSGQIYSFSDTTTTKRSVANIIKNIDPQDVPCISAFGTKNESKFNILNFPNHKLEWLEDTLRTRTATLNEAMDTTETDMDVASGHGTRFKVGDVWRSNETGELIYISAVTAGSDTIPTVIRNWNGAMGGSEGTATSGITNATALTYLFNARLEGDDSDPAMWTTPTAPYNQSQIFHWEIRVSGSEQNATSRYGISDQYKYQLMKALGGSGGGAGRPGRAGDLMIDLESTFFYGERVARTSTVAGAMGGFETYVTTNLTNASSARMDQDMFEDAVQSAWSYGGRPDLVIVNAFNKRLISSWYAPTVRTERSERRGGVVITSVETEFGVLDILLNRWCPTDNVYICQSDLMGWVTLRDWFVEPLSKDGDYRKDEIIGEFSFVLQNEKAHALIYDTATS